MDHLRVALLDLLREFDRRSLPLTVGGGYGLYLKREHLARTGERTLFDALPQARSTNDIDLFLRADIVAEPSSVAKVEEVVAGLRFQAIKGAEYLQWVRAVTVGGVEQEMKLDVLVGPTDQVRDRVKVKDGRRVKAKGFKGKLHAHPTEEALRIDERPIPVPVSGTVSDGSSYSGTVFIPEAFPYLLMKLHAFADCKDDVRKDLGSHHALDAYSVAGMMTEEEYERAKAFGREDRDTEPVRRARQIIADEFASDTPMGLIRMKEHQLVRPEFETEEFVAVLKEIFGG